MSSNVVENTIQDLDIFDPKNIVFCDPIAKDIPQSEDDKKKGKKPQQYHHIDMMYRYPNGEESDFIIVTPELFTFGPQKSVDQYGKISFQMCLKLGGSDQMTEEQEQLITILDQIYDRIEDFIFENRANVRKAKWKSKEGMNMKELYYRPLDKETGAIRTDVAPSLYVKLMATNKLKGVAGKAGETGSWRSITIFTNPEGDEYDFPIEMEDGSPGELLDQRGNAICAIKFSHIYVGDKPSVQMKVLQAQFDPQEMTKRIYIPPVSSTKKKSNQILDDESEEELEFDEADEVNDGEESEEEMTL